MDKLEKEVIFFFKKNKVVKSDEIDNIINQPDYLADEAFFLMEDFFVKFNINKGYIDIDKFFNPLPNLNFKNFFNIFRLKKRRYPDRPKITIEHMIKVAEKKEWFDPIW